jgi:predicted ATPase
MTGVISDFLSELVGLDTRVVTELDPIATYLEDRIMRGRISSREDRGGGPRDIRYTDERGHEFRLHRTSSMISEIAPLVLYLRHLVDPDELLVIEEPESSLHPETQLRLAEALVKAVDSGARVLLTTHSDYFLSAVNQSIQAGTLAESTGTGGSAPSPIKASRVGAYLFRPSAAGTAVRRLPVSARHGIPEEEFGRVAEDLYEQAVELDEQF